MIRVLNKDYTERLNRIKQLLGASIVTFKNNVYVVTWKNETRIRTPRELEEYVMNKIPGVNIKSILGASVVKFELTRQQLAEIFNKTYLEANHATIQTSMQ